MLSSDLPEDVVMEILSRLPVKPLMTFKCVNKAWYALIIDPDFIAKHRTWATSHNPHPSSILKRSPGTATPRLSMLSNKTLELSGDVNLLPLFPEKIDEVLFFGPSNGIICLVGVSTERFHGPDPDRGQEIVLWNPATRESKRLPMIHRPPDFRPCLYAFGFGIDLKTNDYKVVKILRFPLLQCQVEVYNLTTDSWRVIDTSPNPAYSTKIPKFPSYLNGLQYWLAHHDRRNSEHRLLLSFDMSNEVFQEIPLPPIHRRSALADVAVVNDSVALIVPYLNRNIEKGFDIWVMNESGVERTWTKMLTIGPRREFWNLIQFREDGLIVLSSDHDCPDECLVLYDPRTQEILQNLQIYGAENSQLVSYTETLVLVNGSRNFLEQQETS